MNSLCILRKHGELNVRPALRDFRNSPTGALASTAGEGRLLESPSATVLTDFLPLKRMPGVLCLTPASQ